MRSTDHGSGAGDMSEITFPLYLVDRDHIVFMIEKPGDLSYHLERIDIEDKEYTGWDARGFPVELFLKGSEIQARLASHDARSQELKKAILRYANMGKQPFIDSGTEDDCAKLLQAAEAHLAAQSLWKRIKQWLSGMS